MKALDTNVPVRFITRDDPAQSLKARQLFQDTRRLGQTLFISGAVVLEIIWVLGKLYKYSREETITAIETLHSLTVLSFERPDALGLFLRQAKASKLDLADLLIGAVAKDHGAETTLTFDKQATKHDLFELL